MTDDHPELKDVFPELPLLSFQRNNNLRDILINFDIEPKKSEVLRGKSMPCNHPNCLTCKSMSKTDKITNTQSGRSAFTVGGSCFTTDVIYAAECLQHKQLYIGHTTRQLNHCFNSHRSEINNSNQPCELVKHFCEHSCDFDTNLRQYILQKDLPDDTTALELQEDKWITRLRARAPQGMNNLTKDSAQTF